MQATGAEVRPRTTNAAGAARQIGVSEWLVRKLAKGGTLRSVRAGGRLLFTQEAIDEFLAGGGNADDA